MMLDNSPSQDDAGKELKSAVEQAFDDLDKDNSKSFHYNGKKVIVDRDELVENVTVMCALTLLEENTTFT